MKRRCTGRAPGPRLAPEQEELLELILEHELGLRPRVRCVVSGTSADTPSSGSRDPAVQTARRGRHRYH